MDMTGAFHDAQPSFHVLLCHWPNPVLSQYTTLPKSLCELIANPSTDRPHLNKRAGSRVLIIPPALPMIKPHSNISNHQRLYCQLNCSNPRLSRTNKQPETPEDQLPRCSPSTSLSSPSSSWLPSPTSPPQNLRTRLLAARPSAAWALPHPPRSPSLLQLP